LKATGFRLTRSYLHKIVWVAAALLAAIAFFCIGVLVRVLVGPVSLGPFSGQLHAALQQVLPGVDVRFDEAALEWSRDEGRVNVVILGTRVLDRDGRIIAQAPKAEIGLAAAPFLDGEIVVRRIVLVGVQLTLVHTKDGKLRLGIEQDRGESDVLQRIRDALSHSRANTPSLQSFAVHKARLAFLDQETGVFVVAPEAELQIAKPVNGAQTGNAIGATLDAKIEISGKPAHLIASVNLPSRGDLVTGDVSVTGLSLAALAANAKMFSFLAPYALTTDISGSVTLANGTSLRFADFGIGATGTVNGLGKPIYVKALRIVGRYDGLSRRILIDDATLQGDLARAHLTGSADLAFDQAGVLNSSAFAVDIDSLIVDMPGAMPRTVALTRAALQGKYIPGTEELTIDRGLVFGGPLSASFAGKIALGNNQSPSIAVDGKFNAIAVRDLLHYWPLHVVPGGRAWIDANISAGRIGPVLIHTKIPMGAFDRPALPDEAVSVTFPIDGATVRYLHGLTPVTNATGTAALTGDSFRADISSAAVGPLAVSQVHAVIPNLHIHATAADIAAHVEGGLPQLLALLDMKPLQYPTRFHIDQQSAKGAAALDLTFHVPLRKNLSVDEIGILVKGTTKGFALALGPHTKISNGTIDLKVDNHSLHAAGTVALGTANLGIDWNEAFNAVGPITTRLTVRGILDDRTRDALDLHTDKFLSGAVGIVAELEGRRGVIRRAALNLDLTQSVFGMGLIGFKKPSGVFANAVVNAQLDDSNLHMADIALSGTNLTAKGTMTFGPGGDLEHLDMPVFRAGSVNDFAAVLTQYPASGLDLTITGHALDGSGLGRHQPTDKNAMAEKPPESSEPFHINVKVDRLLLREGVTVAPFALDVSGVGQRPKTLTLTGTLSKTAQLTANIVSGDSGRRVTLAAGDAGLLLKGLLGFASVKGGQLTANATMPPVAAAGRKTAGAPDYIGELVIRDCSIINQSFLARLASSGSFGGVVDLMRGQGIALDRLEVPFRVNGDVVNVHDGKALGPSIGITADGYIDRAGNQVALQGGVAPAYGINSMLGNIPLVGNVFVSKKGEGLFGVTYSVRGDIDDPQLRMNPLSALAPGILRRLFEGGVPTAPQPQANSNPPAQKNP